MRALSSFACLLVCACSGTPSGSPGSQSPAGADGAIPSGIQSPVAPDAPCNTPAGAITTLAQGSAQSFAVDDSFAYVSDGHVITRYPLAGGAATSVLQTRDPAMAPAPGAPKGLGTSAGPDQSDGFALGNGQLFYRAASNALGAFTVSGDAQMGPSFGAASYPRGNVAFDGKNLYVTYDGGAGWIVAQLPVDGSAPITTPLPASALVQNIVAGVDGAYVAMSSNPDQGNALQGSIVKIARGASGLTTLVTGLAVPVGVAVDESYVYFGASAYFGSGAIERARLDGSERTVLATPGTPYVAVDAHSVYFLVSYDMMKVDKTGGTPKRILGAPDSAPFVVHGGSLYMMTRAGTGLAGLVTACK
jgi:hypothetical protein